MKKLLLILIALLLCSFNGFSQENDYYRVRDSIERRIQFVYDSINRVVRNTYNQVILETEEAYNYYIEKEQEAYNKFVGEKEKIWGKGNVMPNTTSEWIDYSDDGTSRSIVNFETGEMTIQIIQEPGEKVNKKKLREKVKELLTNRGKTKNYDSEVEKVVPLQETPVLENLVETPSGEIVTEDNLDKAANEIVKNMIIEQKTVTGADNVVRQETSYSYQMNQSNKKDKNHNHQYNPDDVVEKVKKYRPLVKKYCQRYDVDSVLVYAIIWAESSFNPAPPVTDKTHAYGLMQIVPTTAGRDCAEGLGAIFEYPTIDYLLNAENNIEMGVYYLHLLKKRYYAGVTDKDSQTLCVIASYNTGAGNVARALRGDTKIAKAIPKINEMSYTELFKYLEDNLPYVETRNYINKVTEYIDCLKIWLGVK